MPYIEQNRRDEVDMIVDTMADFDIQQNGDLKEILFEYCKRHIKISYNSLKNFCGELRQCANEIERKLPIFAPTLLTSKKLKDRERETIIDTMRDFSIKADGDLNYILFKYAKYKTSEHSRFMYCMELRNCAIKIETDILANYENLKISENGDV